jgi:spore maturation protein CgeB
MYPETVAWPPNVTREIHLAPREHRAFYNAQRFTLNVTRADMIAAGWSPSVRLFEAAACGTPIVSDAWRGLDELFDVGREILVAREGDDVRRWVRDMPDDERLAIGAAARQRVLAGHTAAHRAAELEGHVAGLLAGHLG